MSTKNGSNNPQKPRKNFTWLWVLLIACLGIGGFCYWQHEKHKVTEESFVSHEPYADADTAKTDSTLVDSIAEQSEKSATNNPSNKSQKDNTISYNDYEVEDDADDDPEYREGGKYDPAKYHTDYGKDQEDRRRRFIDNDGFDDDDGYDEYRGYEHENERSDQWDD